MDFDDINPIVYVAALIGAAIGFYMAKNMEGLGTIWKVLTPVACGLGGGLIMWRMSSD